MAASGNFGERNFCWLHMLEPWHRLSNARHFAAKPRLFSPSLRAESLHAIWVNKPVTMVKISSHLSEPRFAQTRYGVPLPTPSAHRGAGNSSLLFQPPYETHATGNRSC
jgi:hypothetical protein